MARTRKIDPNLSQMLNLLMTELKSTLADFSSTIIELKKNYYLPQMPAFEKEAEKELPTDIELAPSPTDVVPLEAAIHRAFCKISALPTENTRLAMRYPGFISIDLQHKKSTLEQIDNINGIKQNIADLVKVSFNNRQTAHNIMHHLFPGLLYQQAIRPIYTLTNQDCYGYFYWSIRPLVKRLTKEQAFEELEAAKEFRRFDLSQFNKQDMLNRIEFEKNIIARIPDDKFIVERRVARVQPFYDFYDSGDKGKGKKKIACRNASLPLIVFGKANLATPLKHYHEHEMLIDNAPESIVETLIIPRKHWYLTSVPKN